MKKFTSALLAVTALTAANVFAAGAVDSKTGAYVGGNVGMANTNVKYGYVASGSTVTTANANNWSGEAGKMNPVFGLFAGYGMQVGTMYFGGEVYGGFDSTKVTPYNDTASGADVAFFKATVKRTNFYGIAPRVGAFITPSTMLYVKLGIEGGQWKATVQGAQNPTWNAGYTDAQKAAALKAFSSSKNSISFVPGLGLDAFITKNLFLRAEYTYMFGPKMTVKQTDQSAVKAYYGDTMTHKFNITQQTFKVGVGYKF